MTFTLRRRAQSNDSDIIDETGASFGQIIRSMNGYTVYVLGDYEQLFPPFDSDEEALDAFEDWAASNTMTNIPTIPPPSGGREAR